MSLNRFFKSLAISVCATLMAWNVSGTVAKACEIDLKLTTKKDALMLDTAFFDVVTDGTKIGEINLTVRGRARTSQKAYTRDDKRVRFVQGIALAIEGLRRREKGNTGLGFYAENKTFTGRLFADNIRKNHASGAEIKIADINGRAADVMVRYDPPRLQPDALNDAVCIFKALPRMMEKSGL
ncbi:MULTISPECIES: hypothetical protein [unclassified Roseovarius]|uniref:hypothetical protein n=1 Tax=unclassified Roseovarius TaxID=2614913 RepID=UPI00273D2C55|nr:MULTISPECIES: hypothetical protein [unclassified Roseovarius]